MANYLRKEKRHELKQERKARAGNECPYCKSKNLTELKRSQFCRNCHRYF